MQYDVQFKHSMRTINILHAVLKQFSQRATLISLHLCFKDGSTEVCMMTINVSISIDDIIRSL